MVDLDESAKIAHKSNTSSPEQVNDFAFEKHVVQKRLVHLLQLSGFGGKGFLMLEKTRGFRFRDLRTVVI